MARLECTCDYEMVVDEQDNLQSFVRTPDRNCAMHQRLAVYLALGHERKAFQLADRIARKLTNRHYAERAKKRAAKAAKQDRKAASAPSLTHRPFEALGNLLKKD